MRGCFEDLLQQTPRDPQAEAAFLAQRIELIRTDPRLSNAQKEAAIAELRRRMGQSE